VFALYSVNTPPVMFYTAYIHITLYDIQSPDDRALAHVRWDKIKIH